MKTKSILTSTGEEISFSIPENWDELTDAMAIAFISLVYLRFDELFFENEKGNYEVREEEPYKQARIALLFIISTLSFEMLDKLSDEQVHNLLEKDKLVDFLFESVNLTNNLLPVLDLESGDLYGPGKKLKGINADEFLFAEKAFARYCNTKEEKYLDELVAILYRPARPNYNPQASDSTGDIRENFNHNTVEFRLGEISKIDVSVKLLVYLYYRGCKSLFPHAFPFLYPGRKEDQPAKNNEPDWLAVIEEKSGGKFGNIYSTKEADIMLFLYSVNKDLERRARLEEQIKKNRNL